MSWSPVPHLVFWTLASVSAQQNHPHYLGRWLCPVFLLLAAPGKVWLGPWTGAAKLCGPVSGFTQSTELGVGGVQGHLWGSAWRLCPPTGGLLTSALQG